MRSFKKTTRKFGEVLEKFQGDIFFILGIIFNLKSLNRNFEKIIKKHGARFVKPLNKVR